MEIFTVLLSIFVTCASIFYFFKVFVQTSSLFVSRRYPPGPFSLPIIGNSYLIKSYCKKYGGLHKALFELSKYYESDIIGLNFGGKYVVVLQNDELIEEALLKDELLGRPDSFFIKLRSMGTNKGITMTNGYLWQEQRAFAMKHLRSLGFGKEIMESLIQEEIRKCIVKIPTNSINIDLKTVISKCVVNVLWAFITGTSFDREELLDELINIMSERSKAFDMAGGMLSQFPWIRFIAPQASGYNLICSLNDKLKNIIDRTIKEHKVSYSPENTRDFIDAFLHEMYRTQDDPSTTFTDDQLIMVCVDLFIAGSVTTSSKIDFLILQMLLSQDIQQRSYDEIRTVLSHQQISSLALKDRMPFVNAVILENDRITPITPVIGPRKILKEVTLSGYTVPKDTTVLLNLWTSSRNEQKWKDAERFCPARFLTCAEEKKKILHTFGKGKRRCPGEILARNFEFLFFTSFLNYFKIVNPDNKTVSFEYVPGMVLSAKPYQVKLIPRS